MDSEWHPISPLDREVEKHLKDDLALLDRLAGSTYDLTSAGGGADHLGLRRRALRRHAIETGVIELLYRIDQTSTEALVVGGFGDDALERAGVALPPTVLSMLRLQLEGLEMVEDYVRAGYPLTTSLVRQAHALITRSQKTYDATDSLGRSLRARLTHGSFKTLPNNVRRPDGSVVKFAPPEQVNGEVEKLVEWYNGMTGVHPVVSAAWLHHRFIQIHPFQDGNGRVGRALTLFSTFAHHYPPIVVDRRDRNRYFSALDAANQHDLAPLARLFIELMIRTIRTDLADPIRPR